MVRKVWYPKGLEGKEEFKLTEEDTPYQGKIRTLYKGEETPGAGYPKSKSEGRRLERIPSTVVVNSVDGAYDGLFSLLGNTISTISWAKEKEYIGRVIVSDPHIKYNIRACLVPEGCTMKTISAKYPELEIEEKIGELEGLPSYSKFKTDRMTIKTKDGKLSLSIEKEEAWDRRGSRPFRWKAEGYYEIKGCYNLDNSSHVEFFKYLAKASKYLPILAPFDEPPEVYPNDAQLPVEKVDQKELSDTILKLLQSKNNK